MAGLIFEVWHDSGNGSFALSGVTERGDNLRKAVSPNATLLHTFTANSDFDASQQYYDWQGWGKWKRPEGLTEHLFTEAEIDEQRKYLAIRDGR